jgi:hypothetical protein
MSEPTKPKKSLNQTERLLKFSRLFNPKDDTTAQQNGFAFNKLPPGDREYRLGVMIYAGVVTLNRIAKRLDDLDVTGLDLRDDLTALLEQARLTRTDSKADQADDDDQDDDDQADDDDQDDDDDDDDQADDDDDDQEPPA